MLVVEKRPRNLDWHHAGPLLFGDWGTSRLYVLGLAFFYTGHASVVYLGAMSIIMAAVAWCYTIVCRCFPEGGGVYSSARRISPVLSVVGATLLLCDYIVTAALSSIEAFHYFGAPEALAMPLAVAAIAALGVVNWFGAKVAGRLALVVAVAAMGASLVIAALCVPFLGEGVRTISLEGLARESAFERWENLVRIMLALSGVEAVSNMTGLMKEPVARTAKRTIWPVLIEVVLLNLIFGLALAGLPTLAKVVQPDYITHVIDAGLTPDQVPGEVKSYRDTAMRTLAIAAGENAFGATVGQIVGKGAAIIFGLLLLSATNTVILAMVSTMYTMGRDRELPAFLIKLNYSGVPRWGLVAACAAPVVVLLFVQDVVLLAELYAVGVVGAITINVLCCVSNRDLELRPWERRGMFVVGLFMLVVELTIIGTKWHAAVFAGGMVTLVLATRFILRKARSVEAEPMPVPLAGWMAELKAPARPMAASGPRIMLAARGRDNAEFAVEMAKRRRGGLFALFVRSLRVLDVGPGKLPRIEDDPEAQEALGTVAVLARERGVPLVPIYVTSADVAGEILDYTVTYGCDTLIMGKSRRSPFARAVGGDVIAQVASQLPDEVSLITRSTRAPAVTREAEGVEEDVASPS